MQFTGLQSCITETALVDLTRNHGLEPRYIGVRLGLVERVWRVPPVA